MLRLKQKKMGLVRTHLVSPEFVSLMIKFDAILLACLVLFSQTIP
jgi:hypothetical protein